MNSLHGILVFLKVVEAGTMSGAARSLGVSTSAVSAALARLECRLGARVLHRTTRKLSPTPEGAKYYARCKQAIADLEAAELIIGDDAQEPRGTLRIGLPAALAKMCIIPHLKQFLRAYPSISIEIVSTNHVPYTIDDGLDLSVQIGELHSSSLMMRRLATASYVICASPSYLAERGVPETPDDLKGHSCLLYRRPRDGRVWEWRVAENSSVRYLSLAGSVTFNSSEAIVAAAVADLGIMQVADYYARPLLDSGKLVEILKGYKATGHTVSVVFPKQKGTLRTTRVFVDFLVDLFSRPPWSESQAIGLSGNRSMKSIPIYDIINTGIESELERTGLSGL